jgi:chaperone modulatory protein CbpM
MTEFYSEDEVVVTVTRLTRSRLVSFIDAALVKPQRDTGGYVFRRIDIARLELLCDLSVDLDLDETALGIVISLIDQLHAARQDLAAVSHAISNLPADLQASITATLKTPDRFS